MGFSRALAASGFQHRATTLPDGRVVYRLVDGSGHVALRKKEWDAVGIAFDEATRPVGRRVNGLSVALYPAIFLFAVSFGQVIPGAGLIILLAIFLGPVAIYLWQSNRIESISRRIEAELASLPRVAAPPADPSRAPRWLEIVAMLIVGPGLIIQLYGSFDPGAFRNTPWSGTHFDWKGWLGVAVLCGLAFYRYRGRRFAHAADEPAKTGRGVDALARARESREQALSSGR
ncbi:MAG TPA: hypothetical protein VF603_15845 [Allosphingosinicella sp.]